MRLRLRPVALVAASLFTFAAIAACSSDTGGGTGGTGGTGAAGGTGGTGGSENCEDIECFRAIYCVPACGAEPVQVGCCPCPEGTFDDIACMTLDAGTD